jgi:hypothetical protein
MHDLDEIHLVLDCFSTPFRMSCSLQSRFVESLVFWHCTRPPIESRIVTEAMRWTYSFSTASLIVEPDISFVPICMVKVSANVVKSYVSEGFEFRKRSSCFFQ